jgi:hypothetical protein
LARGERKERTKRKREDGPTGGFWALGKEKEKEKGREEKGWADWAEKRNGLKERLFHF